MGVFYLIRVVTYNCIKNRHITVTYDLFLRVHHVNRDIQLIMRNKLPRL